MLRDSFGTCALQTKLCLFRSSVMPHTCLPVHKWRIWVFIHDGITGTLKIFDKIDAKGKKSKDILDVCAFLWEYPGSCEAIHIMRHIVRAPPIHCSFRYRSCKNVPKYAYTTETHSGRSFFSRILERTIELRSDSTALSDILILGVQSGHIESIETAG